MRIFDNDNAFSLGHTILWQYENAERLQRMIYHQSYTKCFACSVAISYSGMEFNLQLRGDANDEVTIYWGDGDSSTVTFTDDDEYVLSSHVYESYGSFIIKVDGDITSFRFGDISSSYNNRDGSRSSVTKVYYLPRTVTSLNSSLAMCVNMTYFPLDDIHDGVSDLTNAFYGAEKLTGSIPEWPTSCTHFSRCFCGCSSLSGTELSESDLEGLMPQRAVDTLDCVRGTTDSIRKLFWGLWGGNRLFNGYLSKTFWNRELATKGDATVFVVSMDSENNTLVLNVKSISLGQFTIDWGDGVLESYIAGNSTRIGHQYHVDGSFMVSVGGSCELLFVGETDGGESGTVSKNSVRYLFKWSDMLVNANYAFANCKNLIVESLPKWGRNTTTASHTFQNCLNILAAIIPDWNASMTDISNCYAGCSNIGLNSGGILKSDRWSVFVDAINNMISATGSALDRLPVNCTLYECINRFNAFLDEMSDSIPELKNIVKVRIDNSSFRFVEAYNQAYDIVFGS